MEESRKVTCTKCGGDLILDRERKLYKCMFCGVAFGSSILFDEKALQKAKRSVKIEEFNEADQWFCCVLMLEPGNFEALRGRVLCAGKWKDLMDIKGGESLSTIRVEHIYERIDEAIKTAKEEDKVYFEKFREFVDILDGLREKDMKLRPLLKERKIKQKEADDNPELRGEVTIRRDYFLDESNRVCKSIYQLDDKITPLTKNRKYLMDDFLALRRELMILENEFKKRKA
ncbi:MAG: hypothetical protein J5379_09340 [Clostridiales bacterium]|nr:hypothetical protein [Clostridiales bacterium]